ncbi:MAG: sigma-70 family RNA polymerase sigma factor [Bacteroidota bacterium]
MFLSVVIKFLDNHRKPQLEELLLKSDQELIQLYRQTRNQQIVSILLDRYKDPIVGMATRFFKDEDAVRDFAGDLFVKLVEKLGQAEIRNFKSWVCTLVRNRLYDHSRKDKVRKLYQSGLQEELDHSLNRVDRSVDYQYLTSALSELSENEQLCLQGIYFEDKSYQELMEEHGWTFNQVRGMRERAIKKLRAHLGKEFEAYFKEQ